ncbi:hypothetical protein TRIP_B50441 [uncultured Desulfatiglans sp.]|uniref:Uncharacterized protein n=1 Tax=Uncultured Desulfatiglans sp. TaxID=1748965 RepID=A0A653AIP1_UNCDX|nr:hypothetical protein TRIP_B50441 [uncultured Desulfatiglans sp.]
MCHFIPLSRSCPEMFFSANLRVSLHACPGSDHPVASAQTLDSLQIGQKPSAPDWKLVRTGESFRDTTHLEKITAPITRCSLYGPG